MSEAQEEQPLCSTVINKFCPECGSGTVGQTGHHTTLRVNWRRYLTGQKCPTCGNYDPDDPFGAQASREAGRKAAEELNRRVMEALLSR